MADIFKAFHAVLKVRFKDGGLAKIEREEFTISDPNQNRILDVKKSWDVVMKPGQHRTMNMVFSRREGRQNVCPACFTENNKSGNAETVW